LVDATHASQHPRFEPTVNQPAAMLYLAVLVGVGGKNQSWFGGGEPSRPGASAE